MGVQKYTSKVKIINWSNAIVYNSLSNLNFLNILFNPDNLERVKHQLGEQADKFNIEDFRADKDSCTFKIAPVGAISFRIVEREESKLIKIISEAESPITFKFWIQILPVNENSCKIRLTLHTELNVMLKMMLGKKLDKGINQIADAFTQIPFGMIQNLNQSEANNIID